MSQATQQQRNEIIALLEAGFGSAEIAEQVGVNPPVVWGVKAHWTTGKREMETVEQALVSDTNATENDTALSILRAMASGVDPLTGEILPDDSILQRPQVIRALFYAICSLEYSRNAIGSPSPGKQRQRADRVLPQNAGKPWSEAEDTLLCEHFDSGIPVNDIAKVHGRTRGSISSRLVGLGKIEVRNMADAALEVSRQE